MMNKSRNRSPRWLTLVLLILLLLSYCTWWIHQDHSSVAGDIQKTLISNMNVLLAASSDEMTRMESAGVLAEIGVPAVPHLVEALYSESHDVIKYAAGTLGVIGPDARGALPTLIVMMKDDHPLRRRSALALIGYIGMTTGESEPEPLNHSKRCAP